MTPEENIAAINAQISQVQANLASHQAQAVANMNRHAAWMDKVMRQGTSPDAEAALASCAVDKVTIEKQIANDNQQLANLQSQLDAAVKAKAAQDAGLAVAASKGLTGDVALQKAKNETIMIAIGVGLIAVVVGFWAWRKFIRKK